MDWITAKVGEFGNGPFSRAWRAKNKITLHSLPLLIIPCLIYYICACEGGLYGLITSSAGFDIGIIQIIAAFIYFLCSTILKTSAQLSLRDGGIRFLLLFFPTFLSSITLLSLSYPPLFQQRESNGLSVSNKFLILSGLFLISSLVAFLLGVAIAKLFNLQKRTQIWTAKRILIFAIIHIVLAALISIFVFALLVPVALLHQDGFNETYKVITYGIIFPIIKLATCRLGMLGISLTNNAGVYDHDPTAKAKTTIPLLVVMNICFGASPLFCMFSDTSSLDFFALQIVCHCFVGKLPWLYSIPSVKTRVDNVFGLLTCFCQRKAAVVVANAPPEPPSVMLRRLSAALVVINMTPKIEINNLQPVDVENNAASNATFLLNQLFYNANAQRELAEMISVKIAAFASFPNVLSACFSLQVNTSLLGWVVSIICITFCLDQLIGVAGFMAFEMHEQHIDVNYSLGIENPFDPIRRLRSGSDTVATILDIVIWSFVILAALNSIGAGSSSSLY